MEPQDADDVGLDAEELMHLALKAMEQDRDDDALIFLKHALVLEPEDGRLHYLLGALHAELGMRVRAIKEISRAVALDPELHVAVFQLGMLYLGSGDTDKAQQTWASLDKLGEDNVLLVFKAGMTHFLNEDYEQAIAVLERGCELNDIAESLNDHVAQIIEQARLLLADKTSPPEAHNSNDAQRGRPDKPSGSDSKHVLLSAYQQAKKNS